MKVLTQTILYTFYLWAKSIKNPRFLINIHDLFEFIGILYNIVQPLFALENEVWKGKTHCPRILIDCIHFSGS